jgi:Baculovirus late expression factor 10 (LEF-10)
MSSGPTESDVLTIILQNNLELVDNTYIVLNVVDNKSGGAIKPMCLGEINAFQTGQTHEKSMSNSSSASELPSDETI